jgi:AcrR family transcriptional regulator
MPATDTRRRILDAALASFLEDGYDDTTVARIRARSQVSNGALFHHFPSKESIADAIYVEAISSFQEGLWDLLGTRPPSLYGGVRGVIDQHLRWVERHPDLARFVYMRGHLDWVSPGGAEVATLNHRVAASFREWAAPFTASGEMRPVSMTMITAIVSGPAHSIARRWLAGQLSTPPSAFVDDLADAAAAGLRGTRVRSRPGRIAVPQQGRIRVELMDEDGGVVAYAQTIAPLLPPDPPA